LEIERFCRELSPALVGVLTLHCGDRATAEDLAQEALARAWERWDEVQHMSNPQGWVYRVAVNLATSRARRRRIERAAHGRLNLPGTGVEPRAELVAVRDALLTLAPRQRAAVVLRYYADLSVADTALALDCAEGTVKALAHQGVAALRAQLGDDLDVEVPEVHDA
jgi:RNA polymerase sigma-70 factor (ECF subfamily)